MARFLVAGGAGYIGSHMMRLLTERGDHAVALDDLSTGHADLVPPGALVVGSIEDGALVRRLLRDEKVDLVLHFAAKAYVGESMTKARDYWKTNVTGTLSLLDAMLDCGVPHLIFSSTCATYGTPPSLPITESTPQAPINPYGATKLTVERALADYATAHGLNSVALRYFNAAGAHRRGDLCERHDPETHLIPLAILAAMRARSGNVGPELQVFGDDYETRDGTCVRDYIHVEDLCSAHALAAERLLSGALRGAHGINLGTEHGATVLEVLEAVRRVAGVPVPHRLAPRRAGDPPALVASAARAKEVLGWKPELTNLDEIVATAFRAFENRRAPS